MSFSPYKFDFNFSNAISSKIIIFLGIFFCILFCYKLFFQPVKNFVQEINDSGDSDINNLNSSLKLINASFNLTDLPNVTYAVKYLDVQNDPNTISQKNHCQQYGLYLGPDDIPQDCRSICDGEFGYKFITNKTFLAHQEIAMKPGGYCLPTNIVKCNEFTGLLLKTYDNWTCQPKWPEVLGGDNASEILGCNGYLTDLLTNTTYVRHIPTNLLLSDIYNETVDDTYRFVCTDTLPEDPQYSKAIKYDNMGNKLIPSPTSRFVRINNQCASLIYAARPEIFPNFDKNICNCPEGFNRKMRDNYNQDDDQPCSPCAGGEHIAKYKDDISYVNFPRNCIKGTDRLNVKNVTTIFTTSFIDSLPCGTLTFKTTGAKCLNGKCFARPTKQYSQFTEKVIKT
jgi:hypothetical protein